MNKTPVSLTEDIYTTDLTPWWRYLLVRLNPWRLVRRRHEAQCLPSMQWVPVGPEFFKGRWGCERCVGMSILKDGTPVLSVFDSRDLPWLPLLTSITHYCPLPELPKP